MKSAILTALNKPLVVADIAMPKLLSFGQVLVKVHYSGICGAQLNEIEGAKGPDKFLPHLLGHEGSGVVEDIGPGVKTVAKGDHVVLHWRAGSGLQSETPTYDWQGRRVNAGWVTTFNEKAIVSENRVTMIPKDFDMRLAPLFGCAVTTAMGVINNDAQVKIGQSVVVFGVGGVGLNIVQAAALVSANPIVAIDLIEEKLTMAKRWGATHTIHVKKNQDVANQVAAIVGKAGADAVIDTTGSARVIESAYALTHADGRTILVGVPRQGDNISIYTLPLHFKKVLKGSHGGSSEPSADIPRYIALCRSGKMTLEGLITDEFPLDRINAALDKVRAGISGRVIIKM